MHEILHTYTVYSTVLALIVLVFKMSLPTNTITITVLYG